MKNIYNTTFICSYPFHDDSLIHLNPISKKYIETQNQKLIEKPEHDNDNESSLLLSEYLYKQELLNAFQLDQYNDTIINQKMIELYNDIKKYFKHDFKECLIKLANKLFSNIELDGFFLLFSYDYFHISHLCLMDLIICQNIHSDNINTLQNII